MLSIPRHHWNREAMVLRRRPHLEAASRCGVDIRREKPTASNQESADQAFEYMTTLVLPIKDTDVDFIMKAVEYAFDCTKNPHSLFIV